MIGKFFSRVIKELTPADTSPVTLNATGNFNPRYGKQKIYVSGKGGSGTYTAGNPSDNSYTNAGTYTPGNPYDNSYTNSPVYTPGTVNQVAVVGPPVTGIEGYVASYRYGTPVNYTDLGPDGWGSYVGRKWAEYSTYQYYGEFTWVNYYVPHSQWDWLASGSGSTYYANGYNISVPSPYYRPSNYYASDTLYYSLPGGPTGNYTPGNTNTGTYTAGNYVAGNSGTYSGTYTAGNYVAGNSGTYAATVNTGSGTTVFGVSLPGGYGGAASVVPETVGLVPTYSTTPISITVPSGGYVTITFTI